MQIPKLDLMVLKTLEMVMLTEFIMVVMSQMILSNLAITGGTMLIPCILKMNLGLMQML